MLTLSRLPMYNWNLWDACGWVMGPGNYNGSFQVFYFLFSPQLPAKEKCFNFISVPFFGIGPDPFVAWQPAREPWFRSLIFGQRWVVREEGGEKQNAVLYRGSLTRLNDAHSFRLSSTCTTTFGNSFEATVEDCWTSSMTEMYGNIVEIYSNNSHQRRNFNQGHTQVWKHF